MTNTLHFPQSVDVGGDRAMRGCRKGEHFPSNECRRPCRSLRITQKRGAFRARWIRPVTAFLLWTLCVEMLAPCHCEPL